MIDDTGERIAAVMRQVGGIRKDKRNQHANYDYLSEEAVKRAVQRAMCEVGIVPTSVTYEILSDAEVAAKKGGTQNLVKVKAVITFGAHRYEGLGAGIDYGDKALMKAQTAAIREAWKTALVIPSGNDPEGYPDVAAPRVSAADVIALLNAAQTDADIVAARAAMAGCAPNAGEKAQIREAAKAAKNRVTQEGETEE